MDTYLAQWNQHQGWHSTDSIEANADVSLALVFGGVGDTTLAPQLQALRQLYPKAQFIGCSTAGEIKDTNVTDEGLVSAALRFDHTQVTTVTVNTNDFADSRAAGEALAKQLPTQDLSHVLVISDGLSVNGSELAQGLSTSLPSHVSVTGGLAGDGAAFGTTQVIHNTDVKSGLIVAAGFYGDRLHVGYGSLGGWDLFGPDRIITRSSGNVLYELDGQSALALYKSYLGDYAGDLPSSALLFPLTIQLEDKQERVVRTILGVNEEDQSMTFAGDVPEGCQAQLMRANFDRLVDGAAGAAGACNRFQLPDQPWDLGLLISCVGRKMVLKQRVEEEVEGVRDVLGEQVPLIGFYSYGELSPLANDTTCSLHNQTMTITTFSEL